MFFVNNTFVRSREYRPLVPWIAFFAAGVPATAEVLTNSPALPSIVQPSAGEQAWNWHVQNTDIAQGDSGFPAKYSGPNSLPDGGEIRETVSLDLYTGIRLWPGVEAHLDGLMWQGFGIGNALGADGLPNGEAFRLGTSEPNVNIPRLFVRQTIGFGGEQEKVEDDPFTLAGTRDISRITLTLGKFSVKDVFDNNAYANDPRTQFLNWTLMANEAWDYPADALGYTTGFAAEFNQPTWTLRYGFFQMPRVSNGTALDQHFLKARGTVTELERRYSISRHPGVIRFLGFLNHADMGSYRAALSVPGTDITPTRAYRWKYGIGLNWEQEIASNVGVFSRVGWSDGQNEAWAFSDVDRAATAGGSVKGQFWHRPDDTLGLAGAYNGVSWVHREFF